MPIDVTGSTHIQPSDITFTLKAAVENANLNSAALTLASNTNQSFELSKHGEHLTANVPKDQRIDPPGDAITTIRYEDFVAAIESGAGLNVVLNIQSPLLVEVVPLSFTSEHEHHRFKVTSSSV
jgi:hypothetical protein